jgi:hypothetical protein
MSDLPSSFPQTPDEYPRVQTQPAKKSYRWLIISLAGLLGVTCLCLGVVAILVIRNIAAMPDDMRAIEQQVDRFMQDGVKRDAEAAFDLFSARGQQQMTLADIHKLFSASNAALFSGYQNLTTTGYRYHTATGSSDSPADGLPDGAFTVLEGELNYEGGLTGNFSATVERVGSEWKLYNIQIDVPPEKFRNNRSG